MSFSNRLHTKYIHSSQFHVQTHQFNKKNNYRLIHGHFHIGLVIILRPQYRSRDDNQANMEMPMY